MNDYIDSFKMNGEIVIDGKNIYEKDVLVDELRKGIGMVFKNLIHFQNPYLKMFLMD